MAILIPDEVLRATGMTDDEARVEIACRLFDAGKLAFGRAAHFAGLNEAQFEDAIRVRDIPRYRYSQEMLDRDVETLKKLGRW